MKYFILQIWATQLLFHTIFPWSAHGLKIKSMKGVQRDMLPGYLDEFMWQERAGADKFNAILNEIALQYPVNR